MKRVGLISLVVVLALGALGVGYAAWTDTLTISGTVATGEVDWEFGTCSLLDEVQPVNPGGDYPTATPDYTCDDGFPWNGAQNAYYWVLDKNVAWGSQLITNNEDGTNHLLQVTLHNAYRKQTKRRLNIEIHSYDWLLEQSESRTRMLEA